MCQLVSPGMKAEAKGFRLLDFRNSCTGCAGSTAMGELASTAAEDGPSALAGASGAAERLGDAAALRGPCLSWAARLLRFPFSLLVVWPLG